MAGSTRSLLLAAALIVVAVVFWKLGQPAPERPAAITVQETAATPADAARHRPAAPPTAKTVSPTVVDEVVREDIEKAVVTYSPDALPTFERFLASNEPDVREAARDGLSRLGEKGGAAILRRATTRMTDPEEIKRMQETADWLDLPSATDGPMKR